MICTCPIHVVRGEFVLVGDDTTGEGLSQQSTDTVWSLDFSKFRARHGCHAVGHYFEA